MNDLLSRVHTMTMVLTPLSPIVCTLFLLSDSTVGHRTFPFAVSCIWDNFRPHCRCLHVSND